MAAGATYLEANEIGDFEASPFWSNNDWQTESPQWDAYGYWYRPGYWRWVPEHDGWYSVDSLNSTSDYFSGSSAFFVQVIKDPTPGGYYTTLESGWDQVQVEVTAGETYYVIITARYATDAAYSARISAVAEWSDWITPEPVTVDGADGISTLHWTSSYNAQQGFGGRVPGGDPDAYDCVWNWARKGAYGAQSWTPNGAGTNAGNGWDLAAGVCMNYTYMPEMGDSDGSTGWYVRANEIPVFSPEKLEAAVGGATHTIDPDNVERRTNEMVVPYPDGVTLREFENGATTDASVAAMSVKMTEAVPGGFEAKVVGTYPTWATSPTGWGLFLSSNVPRMAGSPAGPESAGAWSDYVENGTVEIDVAELQASHDAAAAAGAEISGQVGFALHVIPAVALSSSLPSGVTPGVYPQGAGSDTVQNVSLSVTFQAARYRTVTASPPDLQPPLTGAPPCQLHPRDDDHGVGTAAIWPPPSNSRPGSYY